MHEGMREEPRKLYLYQISIMMLFISAPIWPPAFSWHSCFLENHLPRDLLLPLVRDLDVLTTKLSASQILPCSDSTRFILVLHKRNPPTPRHHTDLTKALETAEEIRESDSIAVVGQVLDEENFVGGQVLVGNNSGRGRTGWLETSASCCLRWAARLLSTWSGAFEPLLLCFEGFLLVCSMVRS